MSVSMTPADRTLIESAAKAAGVSVSAWMVHAAREEARWAVARQVTGGLAAEAGVTHSDRAWAASVLGLDPDAEKATRRQYVLDSGALIAHERRNPQGCRPEGGRSGAPDRDGSAVCRPRTGLA